MCYHDLRIYRNFEGHELSYEQWKPVLHLSTRWGFASLRKLALKSIRPPTSHDQLVLARTYSVEEWVLPALTALCSRPLPLSLDEAQQMDIEDVILVAAVREEIRGGALRVDLADIPQYVEMAQSNHLVSKVHSHKLESGSTGQELGSKMDPVSNSVNASTTDLLRDSLNADGYAPAESGKSQLPPMGKVLQVEKQGGDPTEDIHTMEHLIVTTEVPVAAHIATAAPTTPRPTAPRPTSARPTTSAAPTIPAPTTPGWTTATPTTPRPTKAAPITAAPTMPRPTTPAPTTSQPTTPRPTKAVPTTSRPTTPGWSTPAQTMPGNFGGGGRNEGESREGGEIVVEDDRTVPTIITKDSMGVGAPDATAPDDDWGIPLKTKKKKACASCSAGDCSCTTMMKKKKKDVANAGTPVVPSTGGGVVDGA